MPHIRIRAVPPQIIQKLSETLPEKLSVAINTSVDNFTIESVSTVFYEKGRVIESYPFIEVLWFFRSQEIQDRCARIITEQVKALTSADDVVVIFRALEKSTYYENGDHF